QRGAQEIQTEQRPQMPGLALRTPKTQSLCFAVASRAKSREILKQRLDSCGSSERTSGHPQRGQRDGQDHARRDYSLSTAREDSRNGLRNQVGMTRLQEQCLSRCDRQAVEVLERGESQQNAGGSPNRPAPADLSQGQ